MATLRVRRTHGVTVPKAKAIVNRLARELAAQYDLECAWRGNTMTVSRPGLSGTLEVSKEAIEIEVELGLMLSLLKSRIESEIEAYLDRLIAPRAPPPRKRG